jgi:hypothetical protein
MQMTTQEKVWPNQVMELEFSSLVGKTLTEIKVKKDYYGEMFEIVFITSEGETFMQSHYGDCCEHVYIESIVGDLDDLIGTPILMAEVARWYDEDYPYHEGDDDSWTWTFYKLRTIKGSVDIRWYGSSNGYYSEEVTFEKVTQ